MIKSVSAEPMSLAMEKLRGIREQMFNRGLSAYVVPTDDPHQSEYVAACFKRREFISGFTGSAGTAVITATKALLWTDGRYFSQALSELDTDHWTLMKDRQPGTPSIEKWISTYLISGAKVGVDPFLLGYDSASRWKKELIPAGIELQALEENLVDIIWGPFRPSLPVEPALHHTLQYTGRSVRDKVDSLCAELESKTCDLLVLAALDEVAWVLNVRGADIDFNPVIISYLTIHKQGLMHWYVDSHKVPHAVLEAIRYEALPHKLNLHPYSALLPALRQRADSASCRILIPNTASLALHLAVAEPQIVSTTSPVTLAKALKNEAELEGMRQAHLRDGSALVSYLAWLEGRLLQDRAEVSEAGGAARLEKFRAQVQGFVSLSFETISSSGANAAIIHYKPPKTGSKNISPKEIYLVDSGGQYRDGTTDVTRTIHLTPSLASAHLKRCFTRVLQAHIAVDTAVFPDGTSGYHLDILARAPMWRGGLDYRHGTGHGVGAFLNVHEGPQGMSMYRRSDEVGFKSGMTISNEPGYYEDGSFGIRHENVLFVKNAETENQFGDLNYLCFENMTFCPFQVSMLDISLLAKSEIDWLNAYHEQCMDKIGPLLVDNDQAYNW
eukprot:CAMPEP_0196584342 /NCGR_PEP_ID=MMETSP1081-20130531/46711_1 /TAXON_ID=36882 /ORGANISM="Pyramimonas amylifera, Strain CCMP720" /LENGTH=612 /DNA_ID=CAMNT_0041905515 /DNA_START=110 /DNA_END=1945 /DNA_ORIENTATION=+